MTSIAPDCPVCGDRHSHFSVRVRPPRFTLGPHTYTSRITGGIHLSRQAAEDAACQKTQEERR